MTRSATIRIHRRSTEAFGQRERFVEQCAATIKLWVSAGLALHQRGGDDERT
jgi:hypothetical protein